MADLNVHPPSPCQWLTLEQPRLLINIFKCATKRPSQLSKHCYTQNPNETIKSNLTSSQYSLIDESKLTSLAAANPPLHTVTHFFCASDERILRDTCLTVDDISLIRHELWMRFAPPIRPALDALGGYDNLRKILSNDNEDLLPLDTGCPAIDYLLDGGLRPGVVLEVVGGPCTGKSQLCMTVAAHISVEKKAYTLYISSNGSLQATRLNQILEQRIALRGMDRKRKRTCPLTDGCTKDDHLKRISNVSIFDVYELIKFLETLRHDLSMEAFEPMQLLVIDCFGSLLSPVVGMRSHGYGIMYYTERLIRDLSRDYQFAVILTNYSVMGSTQSGKTRIKPALGNMWSYLPAQRLCLARSSDHITDHIIEIEMNKSPYLDTPRRAQGRIDSAGFS